MVHPCFPQLGIEQRGKAVHSFCCINPTSC
nr:MAG TPA: hypothetical protein [Caudoviricetes sp.]